MLVSQQLLPAIGNIFNDVIVFQRHKHVVSVKYQIISTLTFIGRPILDFNA